MPFGRKIYSLLGLPIFLHIHILSPAAVLPHLTVTQHPNLEERRGVEPLFSGWKPDVLTDRRTLHYMKTHLATLILTNSHGWLQGNQMCSHIVPRTQSGFTIQNNFLKNSVDFSTYASIIWHIVFFVNALCCCYATLARSGSLARSLVSLLACIVADLSIKVDYKKQNPPSWRVFVDIALCCSILCQQRPCV